MNKFNLWFKNDLIVENATFEKVQEIMAERHIHKDDVDLQKVCEHGTDVNEHCLLCWDVAK